MSIFRTIAMFIYLFGYMIVHYGVLRRAERALAAGDTQLVEELVNKHIPHWSRGILKVTGVSLSVEGLENIPKDTACVFVGNHRSYYDIPLLLASLDKPHGILAKEELEKTMDPSKYTGRASVQVDAFLKNVVNPVLEANKEALGMTAEINV